MSTHDKCPESEGKSTFALTPGLTPGMPKSPPFPRDQGWSLRYTGRMSAPNAARTDALDPVARAVANAPEDERAASEDELEALREARADNPPFVTGAALTAAIAERARQDG